MKSVKKLENSFRIITSIILLVLFCSCSASGPRYLEIASTISEVPKNLSRVYTPHDLNFRFEEFGIRGMRTSVSQIRI